MTSLHRKRLWVFIASFFLLCLLTTPAHAATRLRIMTFNAEWLTATPSESKKGQWGSAYILNEHFERIAGVIEALLPDVASLQEVTSKAAVDKLVKILHAKGLTQYRAYHMESNDAASGRDVAFLTNRIPDSPAGYAIRQFYSPDAKGKWRAPYSWVGAKGQKKNGSTGIDRQAVVYFSVGRKKLGFLGLHLAPFLGSARGNAQREAQAQVAQRIIREKIVNLGYIPIVLGDLNDHDKDVVGRGGRGVKRTRVLSLLKDYDPAKPGVELFNAARKIRRPLDRYTVHWDQDKDGVPDENEAMTMIDHILIHKSLAPHVKRVFIDHGHGSQTSDHWPVVVDLEWK